MSSQDYSHNEDEPHEEEPDEIGFQPKMTAQFDPFILEALELPGLPKSQKVKKIVSSELTRIIITETNRLYRRRMKRDSEFLQYELPDPRGDNLMNMLMKSKERQASIRQVYLDPKGYHCIVSTQSLQHCYFNYRDGKIRNLPKIKGLNIKCLNFYNYGSEASTGEIFMASDNGVISLYRVDMKQQLIEAINPSILQLPTTSDILSIEIMRLQQNQGKMLVLLFTTNSSIFCITGPDDLGPFFKRFEDRSQKIKENPMPRGYNSQGAVCWNKYTKRPTNYLWTNGSQLICFVIPQKNERISDSLLGQRTVPLKYAKKEDLPERQAYGVKEMPLAIGITDFHYYLLFSQCLTVINRVTEKIVKVLEIKGKTFVDMYYDRTNFLVFTRQDIYKLDITREDTEVWKLLVEKKKYREAYEVSKSTNENLDYVAGLYADSLFNKREYHHAAKLYLDTSHTFEQIFIKFLMQDTNKARQALVLYVNDWLKQLQPQQKTQRCCLLAWLIELAVYRLNNLERQMKFSSGQHMNSLKTAIGQQQQHLYQLLQENLEVLDESLVYSIMQSHGRTNNLVHFAQMKNNFQMVIVHHINEEDFKTAINNLKKIKDKRVVDVIYKYSHIFFREVMEDTVDLLIKIVQDFKPAKLVGGLMNIPLEKRHEGIELLKYCILTLKSREKSIHNILIFFYATTIKKDKEKEEFLEFLRKNKLNFDVEFALRVFKRCHMYEAQILVYGLMELYSEAVNLALQNGKFALAKSYANMPQYDDIKKKLWIEIARNLLLQGKPVNEVIGLTQETPELKIQDLLPFFNQKIKISDFKDEICTSLRNSDECIQRLKKQMDQYAYNTERIKSQMKFSRNRSFNINSRSKCEQCEQPLFSQECFMFPCLHGFHSDCLLLAVRKQPVTNEQKMHRMRELGMEIEQLKNRISQRGRKSAARESSTNFSLGGMLGIFGGGDKKKQAELQAYSGSEEELLKLKMKQYQGILTEECLFCGPSLAESIMVPFNDEVEMNSWKL